MDNEKNWAAQPILVGQGEQVAFQAAPQVGNSADPNGLVSILVPCCGRLEHTRLSVPRLLRYSRAPFELIFVDFGSLDGTQDYLAGVAAAAPVRVEVLSVSPEADFAAVVSEGVARARGAFVAWVDNDVLVPGSWLQHLIALVTGNETIGAVGPVANLAGEQQRIAKVPYRLRRSKGEMGAERRELLDTQEVDRFAGEVREANKGQWGAVSSLGGFCWLARRTMFPSVEFVAERGEDGLLDAGRFSVRARRPGAHLACCRDLFVHHFANNGRIG